MPGGVNSPVRAFKAVGGTPVFFERAKGAYLYDADGNRYVDYVSSWGAILLGHADDRVVGAIGDAAAHGRTRKHTRSTRSGGWAAPGGGLRRPAGLVRVRQPHMSPAAPVQVRM